MSAWDKIKEMVATVQPIIAAGRYPNADETDLIKAGLKFLADHFGFLPAVAKEVSDLAAEVAADLGPPPPPASAMKPADLPTVASQPSHTPPSPGPQPAVDTPPAPVVAPPEVPEAWKTEH